MSEKMSKTDLSFPPKIGAFCVAYGNGPWLWLETTSNTARETRRRMGEIMAGIHRPLEGATPEQGWKFARSKGYRVVKVDVVPHAAALVSEPSQS